MSQHAAIDTTVVGLGYELVEVERAAGGLLRVTIDHPAVEGQPARFINVEDCERVTRQLQHVLEVEGLSYERLEVSSPGLDRPLKGAGDFRRFLGEQVEVTLKEPFKGRKRFRGELMAAEGGWRIVLADTAPVAAAKKHAASRSAQARAAARQAPGAAADAAPMLLRPAPKRCSISLSTKYARRVSFPSSISRGARSPRTALPKLPARPKRPTEVEQHEP